MPATSSSLLSLIRIGTCCSIRCLRYLVSSKVVSGAREPLFPPCLAVTLSPAVLLRDYTHAAIDTGFALGITIIAIARLDLQIRTAHFDFETVETVFGGGHIFGIEAQQVLCAQFLNNVGECAVESTAHRGG